MLFCLKIVTILRPPECEYWKIHPEARPGQAKICYKTSTCVIMCNNINAKSRLTYQPGPFLPASQVVGGVCKWRCCGGGAFASKWPYSLRVMICICSLVIAGWVGIWMQTMVSLYVTDVCMSLIVCNLIFVSLKFSQYNNSSLHTP